MNRRKFINNTAMGAAGLTFALNIKKSVANPVFKDPSIMGFTDDDSILIIIDLTGGNDGLNTVIPANNDNYYKLRPLNSSIGIDKKDLYKYGDDLYFNPSLVKDIYNNGFMGMIDDGKLAVIEAVGYDKATQSHFRGNDIYESGIISLDPKVNLLEGWLGRYFASKLTDFPLVLPEHPLGISMSGNVPLTFKSSKGHMGIAVNNPTDFQNIGAGLTPIEALRAGTSNLDNEYNFVSIIAKQTEVYSQAIINAWNKGKNSVNYPGSGLPLKFQNIARLISGGLKSKVYFVQLGSFDFHNQEQIDPLHGQHPILLSQLSNAISLFMEDATIQGFSDRVAGMTYSEFGRRPKANGSMGTDHGAASVQFMFAKNTNITGGRIGDVAKLDNTDLDGNSNLLQQYDFRRIYANILEVWFKATPAESAAIFGEDIAPLDILKPRFMDVDYSYDNNENGNFFSIYPNPNYGNATLTFNSRVTQSLIIELFDETGIKNSPSINYQAYSGENKVSLDFVNKGLNIISIRNRYSRQMVKTIVL